MTDKQRALIRDLESFIYGRRIALTVLLSGRLLHNLLVLVVDIIAHRLVVWAEVGGQMLLVMLLQLLNLRIHRLNLGLQSGGM